MDFNLRYLLQSKMGTNGELKLGYLEKVVNWRLMKNGFTMGYWVDDVGQFTYLGNLLNYNNTFTPAIKCISEQGRKTPI